VQTGYNALKEAGEWVDRTLFGNYLPGLANEENPDTMRWDNPTRPLVENFDRFGNIMEDNVYTETIPTETINVNSETAEGYGVDQLKRLLETIDISAEVAIKGIDIDVPQASVSYPDEVFENINNTDDFQVEPNEVNAEYNEAIDRQIADNARQAIGDNARINASINNAIQQNNQVLDTYRGGGGNTMFSGGYVLF